MFRFGYTCAQAGKQISRNKGMTTASVFAITAMLLILGIFFVLIVNVNQAADSIKNDYDNIEVFYLDETKKAEIDKAKAEVEKWDNVESVKYRTKDEALKVLKERWGESGYLLDSLDENPLPNSLVITVEDIEDSDKIAEKAKDLKGIEDVRYYRDTVDKLVRFTNGMRIAAIVIMAFLIIVSIVVVSNTIKLTVINRADEIQIMKYVGATDWFVRGPFLLEGMLIGAFSAILAAALVTLIYWQIINGIGDGVMQVLSMPMVSLAKMVPPLAAIFLVLGIGIGAGGSIVSMRRFLET